MSRPLHFESVAIIGVGLLGASLSLAMRRNGLCGSITGYGRKEENLKRAKKAGIIDDYRLDVASAVDGADLVVLCTPVGLFTSVASDMRTGLERGAIVTDVGSVKGRLVAELEALMPEGVNFIGSHPIAGGDKSGIDEARHDLFTGARCIITPTGQSEKTALDTVTSIWKKVGGRVEVMNPFLHDEVFALISHLPHLVAYALVNTVESVNPDSIEYSGGGLRDSTRIAMSSPELWRDISMFNRENLLNVLDVFRDNIDRISRCIEANDWEWLEKEFARAQKLRLRLKQ
jgi:prephenate dehydrogenase